MKYYYIFSKNIIREYCYYRLDYAQKEELRTLDRCYNYKKVRVEVFKSSIFSELLK